MSTPRIDRDRSKTELRRGTASALTASPTPAGTGQDEQAFLFSSLSNATLADNVHAAIPDSSGIPPAPEFVGPGAQPT